MRSLESSNSPTNVKNKRHFQPPTWMRIIVIAMRLIAGISFIISGWAKSIDIWGSVIKINEYLQAWGWEFPSSLVTVGAMLMAGTELVLGFLLMTGCYRRVAVWILTAMMAFFLPLTLYIWIENPVSDCGCFGDLIVLSNRDTFLKNILLTAALIILILWNKRVKGLFIPYTQWIVGAILTIYVAIISITGLYSQPLVDFRRFAVDTSIVGDNNTQSAEYLFTYSKDGETKEFDVDNLPDSTWTYIDRKLIAGSEKIADAFNLYNGDEDVAPMLLNDGQVLLITIPDADDAFGAATIIDDIAARADSCGYSTVLALGDNSAAVERYINDINPSYDVVSSESKQLKELARGDIAITALDNNTIRWKRTLMSIPRSFLYESSSCDFESLAPWGTAFVWTITIICIGTLFILFLADRGILHLTTRHSRKTRSISQKESRP